MPTNHTARLYWVTTPDGDEDWFVLAYTAKSASSFHDDYEGYEIGDAKAELIMQAPKLTGSFPRHAQLEDLKSLGFQIADPNPRLRIVRLGARVFPKGPLQHLVANAQEGRNEPEH
jgi:hypothetical protein